MSRMQSDFMPPFDEGVAQLNVLLPPGTSLQRSKEVATMVERRLQKIHGVEGFVAALAVPNSTSISSAST